MRFLCISDVHGHADALERVLNAAQVQGWDVLICCGDLLFPGPKPLETWQLLVENQAVVTQGLTDRAVASVEPESLEPSTPEEEARVSQLLDLHERLGELIIARLGKLPVTASLPLEGGTELLITHGSPTDPTEPLTVDMSDDEMEDRIGNADARLLVCGGSHVAFERELENCYVVGVGSVGEAPGGQYAAYTLIDSGELSLAIRQEIIEL